MTPCAKRQSKDVGARLPASPFHLVLRQSVENTEGNPVTQFSAQSILDFIARVSRLPDKYLRVTYTGTAELGDRTVSVCVCVF